MNQGNTLAKIFLWDIVLCCYFAENVTLWMTFCTFTGAVEPLPYRSHVFTWVLLTGAGRTWASKVKVSNRSVWEKAVCNLEPLSTSWDTRWDFGMNR